MTRFANSVLVLLGLVLLSSTPVAAQTPLANPTSLEFTPSADHAAVSPVTQTPLVTGYQGKYYKATDCAATAPFACTGPVAFTLQYGKPPVVAGKISLPNVFTGMVLNTLYRVVVETVGPGGASAASGDRPFGNETIPAPAPAAGVQVKGG